MAKLAIKGHETRGKEVIEILEMLGGRNVAACTGANTNKAYVLASYGSIDIIDYVNLNSPEYYLCVFTLEEFLEKFPYKVGDSVSSKYLKNYKIEKAEWESRGNRVIYKLQGVGWHSVEDLQPYKEEIVKETDTMNHTSEINLNHPCFKGCNEIEIIIPDGWEFKQRDNKMFGVRKQYPKTYEECCEIIHSDPKFYVDTHLYSDTLEVLYKLLICRDAYWKIAGEEMGLGKPWEPDWDNEDKRKHVITCQSNNIIKDTYFIKNTILAFPTAEMRDAFYENFKDLIEEAKNFYNV